jgi:hypothetical protein
MTKSYVAAVHLKIRRLSEDLQDDPKSSLPSASANVDTLANISKVVT